MNDHWYMLTLVGRDRSGIVARVSHALFEGGCQLGETSMIRLGGNFTIMMMVRFAGSTHALEQLVAGEAESLSLRLHVDRVEGGLHEHVEPDVRITVYGADRPGIVAQVTGALAEAGLDIFDLISDVGGTELAPIYILHIEGRALEGIPALASALEIVKGRGVDAQIAPIELMVG